MGYAHLAPSTLRTTQFPQSSCSEVRPEPAHRKVLATLWVAQALLLFAFTASAQTTVIRIPWAPNSPPACGYVGPWQTNVTYRDTAGPGWTSLVIRIPMATIIRDDFPNPIVSVSVAINGEQVGTSVLVSNVARFSCENNQVYEFRVDTYLPAYRPAADNVFSITNANGFIGGGDAELTFTTPPATFAFEYADGQPGQRMLIHKYRNEDSYPSPYQLPTTEIQRPRFRFPGAVNVDGTGASRNVWFRVVDPPDPSLYVPAADRVANDNKDSQRKGVLMTPGCTAATCRAAPGAPLMVLSTPSGLADVVLEGTDRYAGDNYQIEASFDAGFPCATAGPGGTNICPKSAIVTAWKRVYVEVNRMFERGAFLTDEVLPNATVIPVSDVSQFPNPPFRVRLIHAPEMWDGQRTDFYSEEVTILHVEGRRMLNLPGPGKLNTIAPPPPGSPPPPNQFDKVRRTYRGPERRRPDEPRRLYFADAIGLVTGTSADFKSVDTSLLAPLFGDAFVEFVFLKDDQGREWTHPFYERVIPFVAEIAETPREWLARKWIHSASRFGEHRIADRNHQVVFLAAAGDPPGGRGDTSVAEGFNDLWLYLDRMSNTTLQAEALTHEMGHQWLVNQVSFFPTTRFTKGHCDTAFGTARLMARNPPALLCTMTSGDGLWTTSQASDGTVGFHYVLVGSSPNGQPDSEYLRIRERVEPVPQTERSGRNQQ